MARGSVELCGRRWFAGFLVHDPSR
jgi:hypothetical protein